jgi:PAS domain S-box-containing protein
VATIQSGETARQRFAPILETVLDAVVIIDADGFVMAWNDVAHDTFGWSSEEAIGQALVDLIIPEQHRAAHCSGLARYRATGEAQVLKRRIEITALRRSGEEFPVELSITATRTEHDDVFIGYLRDITERWTGEQAARQQAAILSQLAEGVIVANAAGRLTFVNEAAARLHGVAELDVGPEQYSDTYHLFTEDGRPYPPADLPLARALRGEIVEDARWRVERPDGTSVLAIGSARPILDPSGAQVAAVLTVRDDTARVAAERQVRENEARLRALTDNLPGGMVYQISTGADGSARQFLFVSQSHERLTGIPAQAVLEDPSIPYQLVHPDDREQMVAAEAESIREGKPFDVQVRFRRADGELRWCRILSAPREQQDGSLIWDGLQIDITDRVSAELALRELNANLEERVAERTAERNLLAMLVETTDVMVMACDLAYNILAINKANADEFERVYG